MERSSLAFKAGTRGSPLALKQTDSALAKLAECFPALSFERQALSSPGDRDRKRDLRSSPGDFFTQDLDDALLSGEIDLAVHSAKDLPDKLRDGLDFLWLPWHEDPRDVIVLRKDGLLPERPKIGVSSARREECCRKRFPNAELLPVRGNIDDRIAQLDAGKFDLLVMAAAGLARLGFAERISEFIPLEELEPPAGQGCLAITFRADDEAFMNLRLAFVKPVVFAGAGPGSKDLATIAAAKALAHCEICLYDSLIDEALLDLLPKGAKCISVGKRKGGHSVPQERICEMLADFARQGRRVLRLKGGDPGIFGRLAEEVEALEKLKLPYQVIPGVSSLQAATTCTGLLLTRRGESRGFTALAPRKAESSSFEAVAPEERAQFPMAFFMGASETERIGAQLIAEGYAPDTPAALAIAAGMPDSKMVFGTLASMPLQEGGQPGLLLVGSTAKPEWLFKKSGAFAGRRVLLACSETIMEKAKLAVEDFGGLALELPMIRLTPDIKAIDALLPFKGIDWLLVASPSCAEFLLTRLLELGFDFRKLPKLLVCGFETAMQLKRFGIEPDAMPESAFSGDGMLQCAKGTLKPGETALRLCSDIAGDSLSAGLRSQGLRVVEATVYRNAPVKRETLPAFDMAFFSSSSSVNAFAASFGPQPLDGKPCAAIGKITLGTLKGLCPGCRAVLAPEATAQDAIRALAWHSIEDNFNHIRGS